MNFIFTRKIVPMVALASMAAGTAAHAQTVEVRVPENAAELRANIEASMRAAKSGQSVGMLTGRVNPPQEHRRGRTGVISQELDASTLMYSVARIGADGKIEKVCVSGSEQAQKAMSAPAFAKRLTPVAKEHSDVK